jgi:septation ring formation regulator EzrA
MKPIDILEQKKADLTRLKMELEKVQDLIEEMRTAHPGRMEKLKVCSINGFQELLY